MSEDSANILIAEAVAAQGLKGQVKLQTFTALPENIIDYDIFDDVGKPVYLGLVSLKKNSAIVEIDNIDNRDLAEKYVGTKFYIKRVDLPETEEDEYYHEDLLGLRVKNQSGQLVGSVKAVHNFGAGDIVEISLAGKKTHSGNEKTEMFSFENEIFPKINLKSGEMLMNIPYEIFVDEEKDV